MKLFRGAQHKKHCQHLFKEKTQHIGTGELSSCLAQEIQTIFTDCSLPSVALHLWIWGNTAFGQCAFCMKLLWKSKWLLFIATVDTPKLGNWRNEHVDVWKKAKKKEAKLHPVWISTHDMGLGKCQTHTSYIFRRICVAADLSLNPW